MIAVGVDTHKERHCAVALDTLGQVLGELTFAATGAGYAALQRWAERLGNLDEVVFGIDGAASWGAGLCQHLQKAGHAVVEVDRPRKTERRARKSGSSTRSRPPCRCSRARRSRDHAGANSPLLQTGQPRIEPFFFAGAIVPLERMGAAVSALSNLVFAQWSFAGIGTAVDMNARIVADPEFSRISAYGTDFFDTAPAVACLLLLVFLAGFVLATAALLRRGSE